MQKPFLAAKKRQALEPEQEFVLPLLLLTKTVDQGGLNFINRITLQIPQLIEELALMQNVTLTSEERQVVLNYAVRVGKRSQH